MNIPEIIPLEKRAVLARVVVRLPAFERVPIDYTKHISAILACPGATPAELRASVAKMEQAWKSVAALAGMCSMQTVGLRQSEGKIKHETKPARSHPGPE